MKARWAVIVAVNHQNWESSGVWNTPLLPLFQHWCWFLYPADASRDPSSQHSCPCGDLEKILFLLMRSTTALRAAAASQIWALRVGVVTDAQRAPHQSLVWKTQAEMNNLESRSEKRHFVHAGQSCKPAAWRAGEISPSAGRVLCSSSYLCTLSAFVFSHDNSDY